MNASCRPRRHWLTRQLNQYKTIREQLQSSVTSLREATSQAEGLRVILGRTDLLADSQSKKLASIRRRVQDLQKLLKKPSPESGELSKHLQPIKDAAKELTQEVQQEWAKTCNSWIKQGGGLPQFGESL